MLSDDNIAIDSKLQRPLGEDKLGLGQGTFSLAASLVFGQTCPCEDLKLISETDCEMSDSNTLAISLIQRLRQHY